MTSPSSPTIKRLFALSGNKCAFPKCPEALVRDQTIIGEICHIKASKPDGARYDVDQSEADRHGFENLILLCRNHHKVVDDDELAYTVQRLLDMKAAREAEAVPMSDEDASAGATLLLTINQSGLIFAHSMHVGTFNVHPPGNDDDKAPRAAAAVGYFAAELARIVAQEVMILSRVIPSFINTSLGRDPISDDWNAFRPPQPSLYPTAAEFRDLLPEDGTLLVEYYDSLNGIRDILDAWTGRESVADVNAWNVLMQTLQKSLQLGLSAVERFCPDRQFSSTSPAGGTLADNIKRVDASVKNALKAHLARHGVS